MKIMSFRKVSNGNVVKRHTVEAYQGTDLVNTVTEIAVKCGNCIR